MQYGEWAEWAFEGNPNGMHVPVGVDGNHNRYRMAYMLVYG